jgi:hypothetical protein
MARKYHPPEPVHVPGTNKGEELVRRYGREAGREDNPNGPYRTARDATAINADERGPIDPRMPNLPPP